MTGLELLVLSVALGADLFSVALPIGMLGVRLKIILRAAVVFAGFHIIMILAGYFAGHWLGEFVEHVGAYHIDYPLALVKNWASVLGALILIGLGVHMLRETIFHSERIENTSLEGFTLLAIAMSVSIDALAAGFSMGMLEVDLIKLSLILGSVIFLIALVGLSIGRHASRYFGSQAPIAGALVLIVLGVHIMWTALQ